MKHGTTPCLIKNLMGRLSFVFYFVDLTLNDQKVSGYLDSSTTLSTGR
jgi:hypothetical protein